MSLAADFIAYDDQIAAAGEHPLPDWWRAEISRWYDHPTAKEHVAQVGRGGDKSTALVRCMTFELVFIPWPVPRGERHWGIIVSENADEPKARLGQAAACFDAVGIPYDKTADQLLLRDLPLGLWTRAPRVGNTKGPRVVAWALDEAAAISVEGVNPSHELVKSLRGASVTHPNARGRIYSSPWLADDYFGKRYAEGETSRQVVSQAPSWIANEGAITEAQTHELEPDPDAWQRDYLAIAPEGSSEGIATAEAVTAVTRTDPLERLVTKGTWWTTDPAMKKDSWPLVGFDLDDGTIRVLAVRVWRPSKGSPLNPTTVFAEMKKVIEPYGATRVYTDQLAFVALEEIARGQGITLIERPWSQTSKLEAFESLRSRITTHTIEFSPDPLVRHDLLRVRRRLVPGGGVRIDFPRGPSGHCDVASCISMGCAEAPSRPTPIPAPKPQLYDSPIGFGRWAGTRGRGFG